MPFNETLVKSDVRVAIALRLFAEQKNTLAQAARLADLTVSEMMDKLVEHQIPAVNYSRDELREELDQFDR